MRGQLSHAIVDLLAKQRKALHAAEIARQLDISVSAELNEAIEDLVYEGILRMRAGRRYKLAPGVRIEREESIEGQLHVNARGFGFVKGPGTMDDVYCPADAIGGAMHGDVVRCRIVAHTRRGREGAIEEVISRGRTRVVGTLEGRPGQRYLDPDDARVRGPIQIVDEEVDGDERDARGMAAVVEISRYPEATGEHPQGTLLKILGKPGEPDVEVLKVLAAHAVEEDHLPETIAEAEKYGDRVDARELERRDDLTDIPLLTIDPHDARDHDDAIWVERDERGRYKAWIAIADVSHYVREGTSLDAEACRRGCSVYLPDRAVPMLPHALSGRLCSLLEDEVRLCMCVYIELDATGEVRKTRIIEGKMRSRAFLSYDAVARALGFTSEPKRDPRAEALRRELRVLWDLCTLRYKKRMRRGSLDLDVPEARITVDEKTRMPVSIKRRGGDPGVRKAYRIVEEMMLLANEVVAKHMLDHELGTIFRVHGAPDEEKVLRFAKACDTLGVDFDPDDARDPKHLSKFLRSIDAHDKKTILHGLLLRAMQQAAYDTTNIGHFGLASSAYLHFTSPIRRYPDLVVHRRLRAAIHGSPRPPDDGLKEAALLASQRERTAMEVERGVGDVYRAIYMKAFIGDRFAGTVQSVTPGGVWVRIEDPFLAVLVSLDALGQDSYEPDEAGLTVTAMRSGERINLGDAMTVIIEDVSISRRAVYGRRVVAAAKRSRQTSKEKKRIRREKTQQKGRRNRQTKGRRKKQRGRRGR